MLINEHQYKKQHNTSFQHYVKKIYYFTIPINDGSLGMLTKNN